MVQQTQPWSSDGGNVGVLLLHGLTGCPASMRPLGEALAEAGFAVELPLLPGHGTHWRDLARTTWPDWAEGAIQALERLRARTEAQVVVGLSMGGALTLHLACTRGDDLSGIVVINPSLFGLNPRLKLLPALRHVVPSVPNIGNDIAKPGADEHAYPRMPLPALYSLTRLWRSMRGNLAAVKAPVLVFTSRQDHIVEPENSAAVVSRVSSTDVEQVWLERSYHVATLDHDADLIVDRTIAFVTRVTSHQ
ncbi:MAG: alpha/beta hydrolase [Egibacteraceae bacterium]